MLDAKQFKRTDRARKFRTYCRECLTVVGHERNIAKYAMTVAEYADMLEAQGGVCAICGGTQAKRLSVDHDHACCSGKTSCGKCVRGLLCYRCNMVLGHIHDRLDVAQGIVRYLTI